MNSIENFQKIKRNVQRKFPDCITGIDYQYKYFVKTPTGEDLLKKYMLPHSKTVRDAWNWLNEVIWTSSIVQRNNDKFSEERSTELTTYR